MTDDPFETRLDQLFMQPPEDEGDNVFHEALITRMRRRLRARRLALAGAGVAGTAVVAVELWMSAPLIAGAADTVGRVLMSANLNGRDAADTLWVAVGLAAVVVYGLNQAVRNR